MDLQFLLYHASFVGLALLLALTLTMTWRVNLFSLGHHGYYAVGAYTAAFVLRLSLGEDMAWGIHGVGDRIGGFGLFLLSIVAAAVVTGAVGWLSGRLFTRLREDYFAVATLVLAEILQNLFANWEYLGGGLGIEVPYLFVTNSRSEQLWFVSVFSLLSLGGAALLFWGLRRLMRSLYGLYIDAVRDDELAAEVSGVESRALQLRVFVVTTAIAGAAGGLFLHFSTVIVPADFSFQAGIPIVLYVVLGGLRFGRCAVATVSMYAIYELIKAQAAGLGGEIGQTIADWKEVLFSLVLILAITLPVVWRNWRVRRIQGATA